MGSTATVAVTEPESLERAQRAVQETVAAFDTACSRFCEDSELSAVNASAGSAVRVGALLLDAVDAALRAARLTGGALDPTIGHALVALGYDRDFEAVGGGETRGGGGPRRAVASAPSPRLAAVPGWRTVHLDRNSSTLRLARGVRLDLGATAKALAADRAATAAMNTAGCGVLVSLGGDIAIAGEAPEAGWKVLVTDDHRSGFDAAGQWITLQSGGLATSSTTVRRWQHDSGAQAHHLIDPATGMPAASVWRTVSVAAASCLDANIASSASIVRGEPALKWLASLGLPSRLVRQDGSIYHVAGWPSDEEQLS